MRAEENADQRAKGHLTVREVADRIETCVQASEGQDLPVRFEFCDLSPTYISTWRGSYSEPALGWSTVRIRARTLLNDLRTVDGREYPGYKGGLYRLSEDSPLWVDNWGECSRTAIVGVRLDEYQITIVTRSL